MKLLVKSFQFQLNKLFLNGHFGCVSHWLKKPAFFLLFSLFLLLFIGSVTLFSTIYASHYTIFESHCTISARVTITSRNNLSEELVSVLVEYVD